MSSPFLASLDTLLKSWVNCRYFKIYFTVTCAICRELGHFSSCIRSLCIVIRFQIHFSFIMMQRQCVIVYFLRVLPMCCEVLSEYEDSDWDDGQGYLKRHWWRRLERIHGRCCRDKLIKQVLTDRTNLCKPKWSSAWIKCLWRWRDACLKKRIEHNCDYK